MARALTVVLVNTPEGFILINRLKPPYQGCWNGLGGKVEAGETPFKGAMREVKEESGLTLLKDQIQPAGLVHWHVDGQLLGELYLFAAQTPKRLAWPQATREGILAVFEKSWLLSQVNCGLVPDLPAILPHMLDGSNLEMWSDFQSNHFAGLKVLGVRHD